MKDLQKFTYFSVAKATIARRGQLDSVSVILFSIIIMTSYQIVILRNYRTLWPCLITMTFFLQNYDQGKFPFNVIYIRLLGEFEAVYHLGNYDINDTIIEKVRKKMFKCRL